MPTQGGGIPLTHAPDGAGYRIIELPPDLQSLLESDTAPVLTLEHSDTSALLKSPDKTWALRQKNTSNALMLLSPSTSLEDGTEGLAVVSTIKETVELDAVPEAPKATGPNTGSKGRWHEKFGRNR